MHFLTHTYHLYLYFYLFPILYSNKVLVIRSHVHFFFGVCPATHILMLPRYNRSVLKTNWERDDVNTSDDGNGRKNNHVFDG